jgi:hypothetical protein
VKVGDKLTTWFSGLPDGKSTIMNIRPYTGRYKEHFTHFIELTAPKTTRGTLEMAVKESDINLEIEREAA